MSLTVRDLIATARTRIREIRPSELLDLQRFGCPVVDVREPDEFADGHIPGAVNIPRGLLEFVADPASPRHSTELELARRVIVYCASGARAALATLTLKNMGYENVANMEGGLKAWIAADLPTVEHHADI